MSQSQKSLKRPYSGAEPFVAGLAPTYWAHVPLFVADLQALSTVNGLHCLRRNQQFIPLSKCCLTGIIVAVERRSNGSVLYVIDDGTGWIDCLQWMDSNVYVLPPLVPSSVDTTRVHKVGDVVQVFGRIECLSLTKPVCREVHVSQMQLVNDHANLESRHWQRVCEMPLHNANHVLERLGDDIQRQVADKVDLPCADDSLGAWRLFGTNCRCVSVHKEALLYCRCQATEESLDPQLTYREALLERLLEQEAALEQAHEPLRFQYRAAVQSLVQVAQQLVSQAHLTQRLALGTFRALRQDGIVYLVDANSDTYLLVSRARVLEPYVATLLSNDAERATHRAELRQNKPAYLQKVPKARLEYVRRSWLQQQAEQMDREAAALEP